MAHLRLFRPHRGTQSLRFPDPAVPVMQTRAAPAPKTAGTLSNAEMSSRPAECLSRSLSRACGSEVDQQKLPYLICSCRLALLGFWWNDLTADFAARIGLGMDVDVPLTGGKLLRLLGRERRLPLNRVFRGAALLAHPHY